MSSIVFASFEEREREIVKNYVREINGHAGKDTLCPDHKECPYNCADCQGNVTQKRNNI